jgi:hypothetical protein
LAAKNQSVEQRDQAAHAIRLLLGGPAEPSTSLQAQIAEGPRTPPTAGGQGQQVPPEPVTPPPRPIPPPEACPPQAASNTSHARSPAPCKCKCKCKCQSSLLTQRQDLLGFGVRLWWLVLVAAVRDLAPILRIPNAQLARHVESLSASSGSVNSED